METVIPNVIFFCFYYITVHFIGLINLIRPISDHFFSIKFELYSSINDGLFREHQKEELFGSGEVLISDFMNKYTHSDKYVHNHKYPSPSLPLPPFI